MTTKSRTTAPAAPATPAVAPASLSFGDETVPEEQRARKVNPYAEVVKALADTMGEGDRSTGAKSVTLPNETVKSNVQLMQKAGKSAGVSVRNRQSDAGNGATKVVFWTVKRITRKRGDDK